MAILAQIVGLGVIITLVVYGIKQVVKNFSIKEKNDE